MDRGMAFERRIVELLASKHADLGVVPSTGERSDEDKAAREAATVEAMRARVPLIAAGRLPVDQAGRRVGEPDLLVAAQAGGYRPVDVKHHASLSPVEQQSARGRGLAAQPGLAALCSTLEEPRWEAAAASDTSVARKRYGDLLQLAHYQRMLEAAGFAADDGRVGGIIGSEGVVTWFDLDEPIWLTRPASGRRKARSTMAVYDFEFEFRLDIIAAALLHEHDEPQADLLVTPVRTAECDECPWWTWCGPKLAAGSGDVSLVPRVGWRAWSTHYDHGVTDRAGLALLDHRTATLVSAGIDLRPVLAAVDALPDLTPVAEVVGPRKKAHASQLGAAGISTLAQARALDRVTASYSDTPLRDLPEQIDQARAALGEHPAYRRRGVGTVTVPRGDVEVDIDMENCEDGVYLWGTLVTDRTGRELAEPGYRAFSAWTAMSRPAEGAVFAGFWAWLTGLRNEVAGAGLSFRAYCYNAAAENGQLRRIAAHLGLGAEVGEFITSPEWIDLLKVFGSQLVTGGSIGLKDAARLAGFRWTVQDPGGANALVRYDAATGEGDTAAAARRWLLDYNRCDVEATLALRDWLDLRASDCPAVADIVPARQGRTT